MKDKKQKTTNRQKSLPSFGKAIRIKVFGVVQGVGFRPFVFRLAGRLGLKGWVKNIGCGVEIHVESRNKADGESFLAALKKEKPPLALIETLNINPAAFQGFKNFRIKKSRQGESFVFISPDIATCSACSREISNSSERRFHYPFTNCTDCGPRYTIVKSLPYDRSKTTMAGFFMCPECRREYENALDRRYHAQPIACPVCGPRISLKNSRTGKIIKGGIEEAADLIKQGKILAVKGLGGFHLVCDPLNRRAVSRLRRIKHRKTKPLALMAKNPAAIEKYAFLSPAERRELLSASRPIVLLRKKKDIPGVAPHLSEIGFMLPYTPLHHLLLERLELIVATSSNKKDAPIAKDEKEGIGELCDLVLTHNRPIQTRADDSVLKIVDGKPLFLRRARGFVPYPQRAPDSLKVPHHILALGGELKDTISIYKNGYVVTSQFLGDLDEYQNYHYFEETISHLKRLFDVRPEVVVSDLHPDFHTTRYAQRSGLTHFRVQHHFAHILAALFEHGIPLGKRVLGISLDGYGFGADRTAWGGEFLVTDYISFTRIAHFNPVPLPGGDLAARHPWRMSLSYLKEAFGDKHPLVPSVEGIDEGRRKLVLGMMKAGTNSPPTSSCGRLFDAVSFLAGVAPAEVEFEAEAPMRLEALAVEKTRDAYDFTLLDASSPWRISFNSTVRQVVRDVGQKLPVEEIATRFHNTLARVAAEVSVKARAEFGIDTVALAGGVFLNKRLLSLTSSLLAKQGFTVLRPERYSPNDESISLGQVAFALAKLRKAKL